MRVTFLAKRRIDALRPGTAFRKCRKSRARSSSSRRED